jgi:uncharacterized metal-binding protein
MFIERIVISMSQCSCSGGCSETKRVRLIYACSGAADVGQIADLVARQLSKEKWGSMSCLSGIGADLSGFIESAREADNIIIDGCPVGCGKKIFEKNDLPYTEFVLTQFGLVKGSTPAESAVVERMAEKVKASR